MMSRNIIFVDSSVLEYGPGRAFVNTASSESIDGRKLFIS
jgi:hypothetical protein